MTDDTKQPTPGVYKSYRADEPIPLGEEPPMEMVQGAKPANPHAPHVQRMIVEYCELKTRIDALSSFTGSDERMNALPDQEQTALIAQRYAMENYAEILLGRLERAGIISGELS